MFEIGARPHPPQDLYRSYLEQSDVFVGIYWQSYGWVAPGFAVSGIEDEYELSGDRPRLIYVREPAPEREPELDRLLDRVRQDGRVSYKPFDTAGSTRDAAPRRSRVAHERAVPVLWWGRTDVPRDADVPVCRHGALSNARSSRSSTRLLEELGEGYADLVHTCRRAHLGERRSGRDRGGAPSGQPLDLRGGLGLGGPCVVESAALRLRANYREVRVHGLSDATGEFALDDG
jgi:hypothetical protein